MRTERGVSRSRSHRRRALRRARPVSALLALLSFSVLGPAAAKAELPAGLPSGLFGLSKAGTPVPEKLLAQPDLAGIVVRAHWRDVEPQPGTYDWSHVTDQLLRVNRAGKIASLVVITGGRSQPEWILAEDGPRFRFTDEIPGSGKARELTIRPFWETYLVGRKVALLEGMGAALAGVPGLRMVSAQCANATTDDWHIPSDAEQWRSLGYSSEKLARACVRILDAAMAAFPEQVVRMAFGRVSPQLGGPPDGVAKAVLSHGYRAYPDRFIAMRHNLSTRTPDPNHTQRLHGWAQLLPYAGRTGAQMLWSATDTKRCRQNGWEKPCPVVETFDRSLEIGRAYGFALVEIYAFDALNAELAPSIARYARAYRPGTSDRSTADRSRSDRKSVASPADVGSSTSRRGRPGRGERSRAHRNRSGDASAWGEQKWSNPPRAGDLPRGVSHHTFPSSALGTAVGFAVFLPDSYESGTKRYPVIYQLHGRKGNETRSAHLAEFLRAAIERGKIPEVIQVFVNGGHESMYSDSRDGSARVETMLVKELIPHVDAQFRTVASRRGRLLDGFSMGGFGALKLAAKYPEQFSSVTTFGGALLGREDINGRRRQSFYEDVFASDPDYFEINTPGWWFEKNRKEILRLGMRIRIAVGSSDFTKKYNASFHELLTRLEIPHEYVVLEGVPHAAKRYYVADAGGNYVFHASSLAD